MSSIEKIKDGFFEHLGTSAALIVTGIIAWLFSQIAPILLPAIEEKLPGNILLAILLLSIFTNIMLAISIWQATRKRETLRLHYGILWDKNKNPHCPVCKNAGLQYAEWGVAGQLGYRCNPCNQLYSLCDASGKDISPENAVKAL
jgi:hypothetical protein